jgi:signal transduction histidine kinase
VRRWSLRTRLTLVYAGLFVLMAAVLLGVDYTLLSRNLPAAPSQQAIALSGLGGGGVEPPPGTGVSGGITSGQPTGLAVIASDLRSQTLKEMIVQSGIALLLTALLATALGWLLAGRVVGAVKAMTVQARRMSERNLHERIELEGPQDELKGLADTFNAMLARLDAAFEGQRMFVANASHELRTPLAITRTAVDVQLQRPKPTLDQWRAMAEMVLHSTARSERLIDSLLLLARIEQGLRRREPVDMGKVLEEVAAEAAGDAERRSVTITTASRPAVVTGDPDLLRRLVGNLLENAVRHNHPGGWARASMECVTGAALITVANSGDAISPGTAREIVQPFHRGEASRAGGASGTGLGLSIVKSIAEAHAGALRVTPLREGGLEVTVKLPM